jgi:signal transduction histidine kinase/ActR/RegA family two-component response regulator
MKESSKPGEIVSEVSTLYELSLASGQSLDLKTNCDHFVKALMTRKNLAYASVWIRGKFLRNSMGWKQRERIDPHSFFLVHASPHLHIREKVLPPAHPILLNLKGKEAFSITSSDKNFSEMVTETECPSEALLILALGKLGLLKLLFMTKEKLWQDAELDQLKEVISKFTISLEGCLVHESLIHEISERKQAEEKHRRSEETERRLAYENALIAEIGRLISSTLDIEEVYERFAEEVRKLIPFDRININIINHEAGTVSSAYSMGSAVKGRQIGEVFALAGSAAEEVLRTRSGLIIHPKDKTSLEERFPGLLPSFLAGHRSMMAAPLLSKDKAIGNLYFGSLTPGVYTDRDLKLAGNIGTQIAGAIANAQLFAERERAETAKTSLEEQLRQSQKMEAIGRLAGGIAHDFNNLLTVISGYSQLSLTTLREGNPLRDNLLQIQRATERAAALTRQLLAFSRRQILNLRLIDLNLIVQDLDKMLRRIIGEDIELVTVLSRDLWKITSDPSQIEQVILNLAVNSRDAMAKGGRFFVETSNTELDQEHARSHMGVKPGAYVKLLIRDTGAGMSPEVQERLFEPFFTTKEKEKGTGLALSTVYGIIKQSGGNIWVHSELGQGTTFEVYLPKAEESGESLKPRVGVIHGLQGSETVLLVEDEEAVRVLARKTLEGYGYRTLDAGHGEEALKRSKEYGKKIDLLLTDVVMPGMSGREVADRLSLLHPEIKVLYMTGYADSAIVHHGILEPGTALLLKPFTPDALAQKVREILDPPSKTNGQNKAINPVFVLDKE